MNENEAKEWVKVKENREKVVAQFFKDFPPVNTKLAFFMAGIPGAGKTEFAENTIREASPALVPIEHDKLVEYIAGYKPENYYNYRKAGSRLVTEVLKQSLQNGYAFIFDGTLSHVNGIRNIKKALKAGYQIYIVYIIQDAKMAWQLTQAREITKKRAIEREGFVETCNKINQNLLSIFQTFRSTPAFNFWILHKHGALGMENATAIIHGPELDKTSQIEKELNKSYNLKVTG